MYLIKAIENFHKVGYSGDDMLALYEIACNKSSTEHKTEDILKGVPSLVGSGFLSGEYLMDRVLKGGLDKRVYSDAKDLIECLIDETYDKVEEGSLGALGALSTPLEDLPMLMGGECPYEELIACRLERRV